MSDFHFLRPLFLVLWLFPILIFWYSKTKQNFFSAWAKICNKQLLEFLSIKNNNKKSKINLWLVIIALSVAIFAAAGPTWKKIEIANLSQENPVMILLDLSSDMNEQNLEKAKFEIMDLLTETNALQVGLVVYSEEPFLITPITEDKAIIENLLPQIDASIMPINGSQINRALEFGAQKLKDAGFGRGSLVVFAPNLSKLKKNIDNYNVLLVENNIDNIIFTLNQSFGDLKKSKNTQIMWLDMGYYFLFLPILIVLYFFRRGFFVWALLFSFNANANLFLNANQEGLKAFNQQNYDKAQQVFKDKDWKASSLYKKGDYNQAIGLFSDDYNQGNALAKAGKIEEAIDKYEQVLEKNPNHEDAKFNLEYLKKQQEQNQPEEQNQNDNENKEQEQEQKKDNDSEQQKDDEQKSSQEDEQMKEAENKPEDKKAEPEKSEMQDFEKSQDDKKEYDEKAQAQEQQYREIPEDVGGLIRAFIAKEYAKKRY